MGWVYLCLLIYGSLVTRSVLGHTSEHECHTDFVKECYEHLMHFEGPMFPYYGANEQQLDKTCKDINATFECISDFLALCDGHPHCNEDCKDQVSLLSSVAENSGLMMLHNEICVPGKLLRATYLENYPCIENAEEKYQTCYNTSKVSQSYMKSIEDPDKEMKAKCCFFAWYQHCYTDATMNQCSLNATFFVSYSLRLLLEVTEKTCGIDNKCTAPPMSDELWLVDNSDTKKTSDIIDNTVDGASTFAGAILNQISPFLMLIGVVFVTMSREFVLM